MRSGQGEGLWQWLQLCCAREPRATGNKGRLGSSLSFPVPAAGMAQASQCDLIPAHSPTSPSTTEIKPTPCIPGHSKLG